MSKNSSDSGLISGILPITVPGVQQVGSGASWITPGAQPVGVKVKVDGIETTFGNFGSRSATIFTSASATAISEALRRVDLFR